MRIYQSAIEAVKEIERDLWEMGHKVKTRTYQDKHVEDDEGFQSKELVAYSFTLTDGKDWQDIFSTLGMKDHNSCIAYVLEEFVRRIDPNFPLTELNPGVSYLNREEIWKKFLEPNGKFSYTYPERIHGSMQREALERLHHFDTQSRQLLLTIYEQSIDSARRGGRRRVPCTMYYQALHRDKELYLIDNMRSCDLYTHFGIDLSIAWLMADYFKFAWRAECAKLVMQIGSLHAFEKDMKLRKIF